MTGHLGPRLPSQIVAAVGIGSPREMLATFRQHMEELREQHPGEPDRALAIILEEMLASELVKRPASAPEGQAGQPQRDCRIRNGWLFFFRAPSPTCRRVKSGRQGVDVIRGFGPSRNRRQTIA